MLQFVVYLCLVFLFSNKTFANPKMDSKYKTEVSQEINYIIRTLHTLCKEQSGISEDTIDQIRIGNMKNDTITKTYMSCVWLESTMMDEFGNLNVDLMYDLCPESLKNQIPPLIINCHEKQPEDLPLEERIFGMTKCLYEANPENFIMI